MTDAAISVVPANRASWDDLRAVFGARGDTATLLPALPDAAPGTWRSVGAEELARRFRAQTACGHPEAAATSGLVAYLDGEPVGWCAVAPAAPTRACGATAAFSGAGAPSTRATPRSGR